MARKFAAVVFSLGCVQTSAVMALGLGEMSLGSYLNEPLNAQVDLLNVAGLHEDQIKVRLATTEDFKRMGVDRAYFLTSLTFNVEIDDSGRGRIVITSEDPVLEPYLDLIVEARWPSGRLLREYTVLVDPPVFDQSTPVVSASRRVAQVDGEPEPEPAKKKPEAVSGWGTRVDVRDSDLAPGEMPSRAFNSGASPAPVAGGRYMIHRDDTLWRIASSARPAGASVHQTMLEIQRRNPDAFIGGNINRIKAGFIIELPAEGDIQSGGQSDAVAQVREQNQAWREGRTSEPAYGTGPSLRISAEPEAAPAPAGNEVAANAAAMEDLEKAGLERAELEQRLQSMEQQVETLQRIVSLKDDQIAALQGVLSENQAAEAESAVPAEEASELAALESEINVPGGEDLATDSGDTDTDATDTSDMTGDQAEAVEVTQTVTEVVPEAPAEAVETTPSEPEPATPASSASTAAAQEESSGLFGNLWLALGAVVLAVLGIFYLRRRKAGGDTPDTEETPEQDVFADVELTEQALDVEDAATPLETDDTPEEADIAATGTRGYGQRKHDKYASEDGSDALAEAEIYIAYGRYPQAIDLLRNALVNDPRNSEYRLKLLQLYLETGDRNAAMEQLRELEDSGDAQSIASARAALDHDGGAVDEQIAPDSASLLSADLDAQLESDFSDLEIEESDAHGSVVDELDLSADFDDDDESPERFEEDLVLAADSDGLSTKLDLARAYMDMGDDDGARQILEEVAAEGNEELQAEAQALLERIG